jgi:hypothetical protein
VIVELEEAKFGKKKYNKGAYREGQWVLEGADRNTGQCFLLPCPGNKRDAPTLLPLISRSFYKYRYMAEMKIADLAHYL